MSEVTLFLLKRCRFLLFSRSSSAVTGLSPLSFFLHWIFPHPIIWSLLITWLEYNSQKQSQWELYCSKRYINCLILLKNRNSATARVYKTKNLTSDLWRYLSDMWSLAICLANKIGISLRPKWLPVLVFKRSRVNRQLFGVSYILNDVS